MDMTKYKTGSGFKVSEAILEIMYDDKFYHFANKVLDTGVAITIEAWNLAIINDGIIRRLILKDVATKLARQYNKTVRQTQSVLNTLISRKLKLYPDIYRYIIEYFNTC